MDATPLARRPPARPLLPKRGPGDPFDLVGDVIDGQFRVESFAGEGELSVVYKAHHLGVDAPVAIKCLNLPETLHSALARPLVESFKEASRVHYRLARGNLHIARAIASGSTLAPRTGAVVPYLVREWFEGESLSSDLRRRRQESKRGRGLQEALALLESAFDAVSHAHGQGEVHLALNPTNLFLARDERAPTRSTLKVLDFGVAGAIGAVGSESPAQAASGLRLLLPAYAAPEQLERTVGKVGPWTDVYALALITLEVLSDRIVMDSSETGALVERALDERLRPTPKAHGLTLPFHIDRALSRAVARAPGARQASAAEFWRELSRPAGGVSLSRAGFEAPRPPSLPSKEVAPAATEQQPPPAQPVPAPAELMPEAAAEPLVTAPEPLVGSAAESAPTTTAASQPSDLLVESADVEERPYAPPLGPWDAARGLVVVFELLVHCGLVAGADACGGLVAAFRRLPPRHAKVAVSVGAMVLVVLPVALVWRRATSPPPRSVAGPASAAMVIAPAAPPASSPDVHQPEAALAPVAPSAPFKRGLAVRALDRRWRDVAKCRRGKAWGKGWTTVTFAQDGSVSGVVVDAPPFAGTPTAGCIADALASVRVEPFNEASEVLTYRVYVAP